MTMRSWIRNLFARPTTRPIRKAPRRFRPALETLENRIVPTTYTWTGIDSNDHNWSNPFNWGGTIPSNGADLVFSSVFSQKTSNNDLFGITVNSISFSSSGYDLTGNAITLAGNVNVVRGDSDTISFGVAGTAGLDLMDGGTLTLSGFNSYTGATTITSGILEVDGSLASASAVTVQPFATLDGTGRVNGPVNVLVGGTVSPGNTPGAPSGILNTGSVTFDPRSSLDVDLNGTTVGSGYDQLNVTGSGSLGSGNATLNLSIGASFSASPGATFTIINTTAGVSGTFSGLAQGSAIISGSDEFSISYTANSSNEVVLTYLGTPGLIVNNPTDTPVAGETDLRQAIATANASTGPSTITFDPTVFATPQTITLSGTQLELSDTTGTETITGPAAGVTVNGGGNSRVFQVDPSVTASISGLTITGGGNASDGGGLLNAGTTTLTNCTFTGNSAAVGGAISNGITIQKVRDDSIPAWTLTLTNCTITGNSAATGGGVYNSGTATLTNCTVSGNSADGDFGGGGLGGGMGGLGGGFGGSGGGGDGFGGGVWNSGAATLTDCTLSGNSANGGRAGTGSPGDGFGGGMWNSGTAMLTDCTVSDNSANGGSGSFGGPVGIGYGGGVYTSGTTTLTNCTVSGNSASTSGGGFANVGGMVNVGNTIVAANLAADSGPDAFGPVSSLGYNLVGITDGSTGWRDDTSNGDHDLTGTVDDPLDLMLGALADNGGPTQTMALSPYSPAINAGSNDLIAIDPTTGLPETTDQRGPCFDRIAHGVVDIGAYESNFETPSLVVTTAADVVDPTDDQTSLREAIAYANALPTADTITFSDLFNTPQTITLAGAQLTLTDAATTTISGPGANLLSIDGGGLSRVFNIEVGASAELSGLTITGGNATEGGGLFNAGTAALTNCTISDNSAEAVNVSGNGGGVYNSGAVTLANCTISGNSASITGAGSGFDAYGAGGGLFNGGTATLTNCTISGNSASASVTISGDSTDGGGAGEGTGTGGGVFSPGSATLTNCTISDNSASALLFYYLGGFVDSFGAGGGLSGRGFTLSNTIIAGNSADLAARDVNGPVTSDGHNLIGTTDGSSGWAPSDLTDASASPLNLGPLADNGGPTQTMALLPGSPAINAGSNDLIAIDPATGLPYTTDQRGVPFARVAGGTVDIGACEGQALNLVVDTTADEDDGNYAPGDLSLREAVELANANPGADTITFSALFNTPRTITLTGDQLTLTDPATTTITGPGANLLSIDGGGLSRVFNIDVGASAALSGLTITGGNADTGGGLLNAGTTTLTNCTFTGNSAAAGGAISNGIAIQKIRDGSIPAWTLTLTKCTITGNSAATGGGVYNSGTATLTNCTVSGNSANGGSGSDGFGGDGFGGGVWNSGTATLDTCTVSGNSTNGGSGKLAGGIGFGGGVWNSGTVTLDTCTVSVNTAKDGGGLFNSGTATLTDCTVSGNSAQGGKIFHGGGGGGLYNNGSVSLTNCTFGDNSANNGGGLYNLLTVTLTNCTVSGNSARGSGGGLYTTGTATLTNCTIYDNSSSYGGGLCISGTATLTNCTVSGNSAFGGGGGIANFDVMVSLGNTIVAANTAAGTGPDAFGDFTSQGHNLIGITDGSSGWVASDLTDASASPLNLGPLADNGGPTQTMALLPGSPALDAGSNALIPIDPTTGQPYTTDQRGAGFPRIVGGTVDIGAFEVQSVATTTTVTLGAGFVNGSMTYNGSPHGATASWASTSTDGQGGPLTVTYVGINGTSYAASTTAPTNAGSYQAFASFAGDANHTGSSNFADFTIAQATASITVTGFSGPYNSQPHGVVSSSATGVGGQSITGLSVATTTYINVPGGLVAWSFSNPNYVSQSGSAMVSITHVGSQVTVSPAATTVTYNGNPHGATASWTSTGADGQSGTLTVTYVGINGTTYSSITTAPTNAGSYQASASFAGDTNHTGSSNFADFTIAPANATATVTGYTGGTYDGSAHTQTVTVTGVGVVLFMTSLIDTNAGSYSQPWSFSNPNYLAVYESGNLAFSIAKAHLTVTATNQTRIFGAANPVLTATLSGFVHGEGPGVVSGAATLSTTATVSSPVGTDPITVVSAGTLTAANYDFPSNLFGNGTLTVTLPTSGAAAYVLNATANGAVTASGNADVKLPGGLYVDSSSASAINASGNAQVNVGGIVQVGGGVSTSGKASATKTGTPAATSDPLAGLPLPGLTGMTNYGAVSVAGNSSKTLSPGIYTSIQVSGNASVTLSNSGTGIYIIEGGGLSVSGNASLSGSGVLIFNAGSSYNGTTDGGTFGSVALGGNGTISLSGPTSGPDAGVVIFQSRSNTKALSLGGNGTAGISSTIYASAANAGLSGNATVNGTLVVSTLTVSGNAGAFQLAGGASSDYVASTNNWINNAVLTVAVQDDTGNGIDPNEIARLDDAMSYLNQALGSFGVYLSWAAPGTSADVHIHFASTTPEGDASAGVLGFTTAANDVYLVTSGWNFYTGSDPTQIGTGQYDLLTLATHELAHTVGLGESVDPSSVMYEYLAPGTVRRTFTDSNLSLIDTNADRFMKTALPAAQRTTAAALSSLLTAGAPGLAIGWLPAGSIGWESALWGPSVSAKDGHMATTPGLDRDDSVLMGGPGHDLVISGQGRNLMAGVFGLDGVAEDHGAEHARDQVFMSLGEHDTTEAKLIDSQLMELSSKE